MGNASERGYTRLYRKLVRASSLPPNFPAPHIQGVFYSACVKPTLYLMQHAARTTEQESTRNRTMNKNERTRPRRIFCLARNRANAFYCIVKRGTEKKKEFTCASNNRPTYITPVFRHEPICNSKQIKNKKKKKPALPMSPEHRMHRNSLITKNLLNMLNSLCVVGIIMRVLVLLQTPPVFHGLPRPGSRLGSYRILPDL